MPLNCRFYLYLIWIQLAYVTAKNKWFIGGPDEYKKATEGQGISLTWILNSTDYQDTLTIFKDDKKVRTFVVKENTNTAKYMITCKPDDKYTTITFTITNVTIDDSGVYRCREDLWNYNSKNITIAINGSERFIENPNAYIDTTEKSDKEVRNFPEEENRNNSKYMATVKPENQHTQIEFTTTNVTIQDTGASNVKRGISMAIVFLIIISILFVVVTALLVFSFWRCSVVRKHSEISALNTSLCKPPTVELKPVLDDTVPEEIIENISLCKKMCWSGEYKISEYSMDKNLGTYV